tara:strand:- start:152 stop:622 length:471 start_codon:yes stop_codon:yes gene_type:complete
MSTIFADKFKNTSGGNNVKVNQLSGIDTAGSITVQGENTNTTNLQQGIAKQWVLQKQKSSHQTMDSFNTSSVDDHATAIIEPKFTNNMASDNYVITGGVASGTYNGVIMMPSSTGGDDGWTVATTGYYIAGRGNGSNYTLYADIERVPVVVHGDLA